MGGGFIALLTLSKIWRSLFAATVSQDLALAEGVKTRLINVIFMIVISAVIAVSLKLVGVLLITALLIIPAASARRFSNSPEIMAAVIAAIIGIISVSLGLHGSLVWDTPAGPSVVVAALACFCVFNFTFSWFKDFKS